MGLKLSVLCYSLKFHEVISRNFVKLQCVKHARIQIFSEPHFLIQGQSLRSCPHTGKYRLEKTSDLTYFTYC